MKISYQKGVIAFLLILSVSGCSSAINPFYQMHPQSMQSFKDRRPPRDNIFAEKGGFAKKKPIDPFQEQALETGGYQQGLIGDIETPAVINTPPQQPQKIEAIPNNIQSTPNSEGNQQTPPAAAPNTANKTADAYDYLRDISSHGAMFEQGSGNNNYGYNYYELADEIGAPTAPTITLQPVVTTNNQQTKPAIIKAHALDDLPPSKQETRRPAQQNANMCKLNKNNLLWRNFADSSSGSSTSADGQITPQELQHAKDAKYPELKDVPVNSKNIKTS